MVFLRALRTTRSGRKELSMPVITVKISLWASSPLPDSGPTEQSFNRISFDYPQATLLLTQSAALPFATTHEA